MWWFFQYKKFGKLSEYNAITLKGYKSVESEKIPLIRCGSNNINNNSKTSNDSDTTDCKLVVILLFISLTQSVYSFYNNVSKFDHNNFIVTCTENTLHFTDGYRPAIM